MQLQTHTENTFSGNNTTSDESFSQLMRQYGHLEATDLLEPILDRYKDKIVVSSSFGAESAILLHMVASINPKTPVIFADTGKLFPETIAYRDTLVETFGLTDIRIVKPDPMKLLQEDPNGDLWTNSTDLCCHIRKVLPFEQEIAKFSAIITGRKRYQATTRSSLKVLESDGKHIKVNPVARWDIQELKTYMEDNQLPAHPLVAKGYLSIGCEPCTSPVKEGEDPRAGRWRNQDKTECGIHYVNGKMVRKTVNA